MKILVTGGAGFIGSNYVRYLLEHSDDQVTAYDALTYAGNPYNLEGTGLQLWRADICDRETFARAVEGQDAVVHLAAESHVDRSIVNPDDFMLTNCLGTNVVMDGCRRAGIERIVHVSTDEVYGSVRTGFSVETDVLDPRSPYAASKAGSDLIARSFFTTHDLPVMITRSSNNFGPYQHPEKLIPLAITNLLEGKPIPLYGDGMNRRDWLYVEDNCAAIDLVLRQGTPGEIYNIGAGNEKTNHQLVNSIRSRVGRGGQIDFVKDRLGHDRRYAVDSSKIEALGWKPEWSFGAALDATVRWYKDNRRWWEGLK